jgi:hypothetical protein
MGESVAIQDLGAEPGSATKRTASTGCWTGPRGPEYTPHTPPR